MARSSTQDPLKTFRFLVYIPGGITDRLVAGFTSVTGLEGQAAVDSLRGGGNNDAVQQSPGLPSYPNITLMRGQILDESNQLGTDLFYNWWLQVHHYQAEGYADRDFRRDWRIDQMRREGVVARTWNIKESWPVRYKAFGDLAGGESGNSIEEIELAHEGFGDPNGLTPPPRGGTLSDVLGVGT